MPLKRHTILLLSLLSGLILALGWPERGFAGLLFIALVPLLLVEDHISNHKERFGRFSVLFYTYPGFLAWNLLTTWWIVNSTLPGAILANTLNSLFMAIVFQAYHWTRITIRSRIASYTALVSYWVAFEYLHLNWDLNWPWLNLGNGFATYYKWIQWYEFTGTMGGTVWILVSNILVTLLITQVRSQKSKVKSSVSNSEITESVPPPKKNQSATRPIHHSIFNIQYSIALLLWILAPILLSYRIYNHYTEEKQPVHFVVVQPNLDPYSEQYGLNPPEVINRIMRLAGPVIDSATNFFIAPESAIQEQMWENDMSTFMSIRMLGSVIDKYPELNIIIGGSTFYEFEPGETVTVTARKFTASQGHYDAYNTAIMMNSRDSLQLYHKSKLTPGVEIMPSLPGLKWIEKYAIDLGGTVGSLGRDSVRKVFTSVNTVRVAPVICYESIFGEFFAEFVRNGARIMIIITNDGWWGNTAGHRQHYSFAHLRAIETRRSIARSANTGISAFIDQRGDAFQVTPYWQPACIKGTLNASSRLTFFVIHGDYLARYLSWLAAFLVGTSLIFSIKDRYLRHTGKFKAFRR